MSDHHHSASLAARAPSAFTGSQAMAVMSALGGSHSSSSAHSTPNVPEVQAAREALLGGGWLLEPSESADFLCEFGNPDLLHRKIMSAAHAMASHNRTELELAEAYLPSLGLYGFLVAMTAARNSIPHIKQHDIGLFATTKPCRLRGSLSNVSGGLAVASLSALWGGTQHGFLLGGMRALGARARDPDAVWQWALSSSACDRARTAAHRSLGAGVDSVIKNYGTCVHGLGHGLFSMNLPGSRFGSSAKGSGGAAPDRSAGEAALCRTLRRDCAAALTAADRCQCASGAHMQFGMDIMASRSGAGAPLPLELCDGPDAAACWLRQWTFTRTAAAAGRPGSAALEDQAEAAGGPPPGRRLQAAPRGLFAGLGRANTPSKPEAALDSAGVWWPDETCHSVRGPGNYAGEVGRRDPCATFAAFGSRTHAACIFGWAKFCFMFGWWHTKELQGARERESAAAAPGQVSFRLVAPDGSNISAFKVYCSALVVRGKAPIESLPWRACVAGIVSDIAREAGLGVKLITQQSAVDAAAGGPAAERNAGGGGKWSVLRAACAAYFPGEAAAVQKLCLDSLLAHATLETFAPCGEYVLPPPSEADVRRVEDCAKFEAAG